MARLECKQCRKLLAKVSARHALAKFGVIVIKCSRCGPYSRFEEDLERGVEKCPT